MACFGLILDQTTSPSCTIGRGSPHFLLNQLQTHFLAQQARMAHAGKQERLSESGACGLGVFGCCCWFWFFFFFWFFFSFISFFLKKKNVDNILLPINTLPSPLLAHAVPSPAHSSPRGRRRGRKGRRGFKTLPSQKTNINNTNLRGSRFPSPVRDAIPRPRGRAGRAGNTKRYGRRSQSSFVPGST